MSDQDGGGPRILDFEARPRVHADESTGEQLRRKPDLECPHPQFLIDSKQRTVECGKCGAWLDPVWCLLRHMERRESIEARITMLRDLEKGVADRAEARRTYAIKKRQDAREKLKRDEAKKNCGACDGTGWARTPNGVVKCGCRTGKGVALLL